MKKITVWKSINEKTGKEIFNHIEDGWNSEAKPQPIKPEYTNQMAWHNLEWSKENVWLFNNKIVRSLVSDFLLHSNN